MLPMPVKGVLLIQKVYGRYDQSTNVYTPTIGSSASIAGIGINSLNSYTPSVGNSDSVDIGISSPESNTALAYESESDEWSYICTSTKGLYASTYCA